MEPVATTPPDVASAAQDAFSRYGDRTNSLVTLYPDFETFTVPGLTGMIRFVRAGECLVAAGEPLAPAAQRGELLAAFASAASGARVLALPLGPELARELAGKGFHVWQAGSEPVFELAEYCGAGNDPLRPFPVARALARRGAQVVELDGARLTGEERQEIEELTAAWLDGRPGLPLGFLSQVRPLHLAELKRYFLLRVRGQLQAFIAAAPFCREGSLRGYYFLDVLRHPRARAGANDLLVIEAMRLLHERGVAEARLGMAPLARLDPNGPGAAILGLAYRHWRLGYNFRSLHEYKEKFRPTRWEPLFMAATAPSFTLALADALRAHFPGGLFAATLHVLAKSFGRQMALRPRALARIKAESGARLMPRSFGEFLRRTACTTALVACFTLLHAARAVVPALNRLFEGSAYVPGKVTLQGLVIGPLFHNHWFHLIGDQLTLYAAGAMIELILGPAALLLFTAAGLWLSNPLTDGLLSLFLEDLSPTAWERFLSERDYGSSNAVFALVGAYAALLRHRAWVLGPFLIYGLFICLARQSPLALHHLLMLGAGYLAIAVWLRPAGKRQP